MANRLIDVVIPEDEVGEVQGILRGSEIPPIQEVWSHPAWEGRAVVRILLEARYVEQVLDALGRRFNQTEGYRSIVTAVEATLPVYEDEEEEVPPPQPEAVEPEEVGETHTFGVARISREELYSDIQDVTRFDGRFVFLTLIATITAAIGLLQNNVAIVIGSMVIAPFLGPLVALSLATTLGDQELARKAVRANVAGFSLAVAVSFLIGAIVEADPAQVLVTDQLLLRASPTLSDVGVGLAVGAAGPLAFTTGAPTALVGVMVAAALLPPTVAFGMFLGGGEYAWASGALLLILVYLISANLSGVATFAAQGIRPANWWEEVRARRATAVAVVAWSILLLVLAALIWWLF